MLKLEDLQKMWEADAKIDKSDLGEAAAATPNLHAKYVIHLARVKLLMRQAEVKYKKMRNLRWEWMRGKLSKPELDALGWEPYLHATPLKSERDDLLDADELVIKAGDRYEYLNTMFETLQSIMKSIHSRTWDVKNTIEWVKFTNGYN